ncbi:galactose-1-phosphate uridylyltransferase [Bifidobacterium sp. ESL0800]|uniref:galactose-1-phosphate uridylyltransferase n=1 Tax=Bifidobacterium sp. ESL0800 TaxID=2983236 RepID=UPI0023F796CC|nr:galactose-1-phosphate uridylyltransferase [Bifidobacterium sp. ESL0800]WEV74948.1 galactose-1-phosphate uridylyltransferase [Bifidobacterium sp. ESL0800]
MTQPKTLDMKTAKSAGAGRAFGSEDGKDAGHDFNEVYDLIDALLGFARVNLGLAAEDVDWARNRVLELFGLASYVPGDVEAPAEGPAGFADPSRLLHRLCVSLDALGLADSYSEEDVDDMVMGALSARPSTLRKRFRKVEASQGAMNAMDWFYRYCVANTAVKKAQLDRNPRFESHGLIITINQAKPEFKNMKKARSGNSVSGGYPRCTICHENEGFAGRDKRTLRTIPVELGGAPFFWQFSPYGYFHQHGICVNMEHTPMHVDRTTFGNLMDFVDRFPGYFLGCNAALPRIGGSVLAHDHYQGGGELMPMHKAQAWKRMGVPGLDKVQVEILDWPGTAIRVVSRSREAIVEVADTIRRGWEGYDNAGLDILAKGKDGRQSAVSPSVCLTLRGYEMNLILRNNAVSSQYPEGIFHVHPQFWAIKQEPIGLIEAQGLFVLPGRLIGQLSALEQALVEGRPLPQEESEFAFEWNELQEGLRGPRTAGNVHAAVRDELGSVCRRILANTAVFKHKEDTMGFLEGLGLTVQ